MRKHLIGLTGGLWVTTGLVAYNNPLEFYGTWICVAIAAVLTMGLIFSRNSQK